MMGTRRIAAAVPRMALAVGTGPHFRTAAGGSASPVLDGNAWRVTAPHTHVTRNSPDDYTLSHAIYTNEEAASVQQTHYPEKSVSDKVALKALRAVRKSFDFVTGYGHDMTTDKYLTRMIYLETVAGVPGMVGGMCRHLRSLRSMQRDAGWIHTLLEEAENERMHLLTFLTMKQPGPFMRAFVLAGQGVFFNLYFAAYLLAPATCHRFIGFLEEEAVATYTKAIADLDAGKLPEWGGKAAPELAKKYWRLAPDATMRELLLAIRADESIHRDVNHVLASLPPDAKNPFL